MDKKSGKKLSKAELVAKVLEGQEQKKQEAAKAGVEKAVEEVKAAKPENKPAVAKQGVENAVQAVKDAGKPASTPKPAAKPAAKVDVSKLVAKLPDVVRPKNLDELFGYDDGGKTIRRALRAKFTTASKHEHKKDWEWKKSDPVLAEILGYFVGRTSSKTAVAK
jgi:hypothetical protein